MLRVLPYILFGFMAYLAFFYVENFQPELKTRIVIGVDIFGLTDEGKEEQYRLSRIKALTIPYEQKQVLVMRKVFMGATPDMVRLALGEPTKSPPAVLPDPTSHNVRSSYIYYLAGEKRPTVLVFEVDPADQQYKLINAYKGSALDLGD